MKYTEQQFEDIVRQFNSSELPKSAWTHEAHILVAFWHVSRYDEPTALDRVRRAIKDYNTSVGTINNDTSGYHETLTVFWLKVVRRFFEENAFTSVIDAINAFIDVGHADKKFPLKFYSEARLLSVEARRQWTEPDKQGLEGKNSKDVK